MPHPIQLTDDELALLVALTEKFERPVQVFLETRNRERAAVLRGIVERATDATAFDWILR